MLGKLIKIEVKASAHMMANIYIAALVTIGVMLLAYLVDINWLSGVATIALMFIAIIALIITFVGVIVNFYKTLYGPQGYLSFTLPVKSGALLASKAIVAFLWMLISYAISIGIFVGVFVFISAEVGEDNIEMIKMLIQMFSTLPSDAAIRGYLILAVVTVFIQLAFLISELFFSITFANTRVMQKLGIMGALIVFFVVYIICQIIMFLLTNYVPITLSPAETGLVFNFGQAMSGQSDAFAVGLTGVIFQAVASFVLFFGTGWLMKHKVNIK